MRQQSLNYSHAAHARFRDILSAFLEVYRIGMARLVQMRMVLRSLRVVVVAEGMVSVFGFADGAALETSNRYRLSE